MATNRVRACARKITVFHERFGPCFGRTEARSHSLVYLKGLLLGDGHKNVERIALRFSTGRDGGPATQNEVVALQEFLTLSPWQARSVQDKIQEVFAEELVPSTAAWPLGTVGVVDESAFVKSGPESCGVSRQWCGRLGKRENCQVGVYLLGVTPAGTALLDHGLYLPQDWAGDQPRRGKTGVPAEVKFQTKPEIASQQIARTRTAGHVTFDWITADELYGRNGNFLERFGTRRPTLCRGGPCQYECVDLRSQHADAFLVWQWPTAEEPPSRQCPEREGAGRVAAE